MKILFDHNVPRSLRKWLAGHEVKTAWEMNWSVVKDGPLLQKAESHGFELMITGDSNLTYQQNLKDMKIALIVLGINNWPLLKSNIQPIVSAVNRAKPGKVILLDKDIWLH